uniref:C6H2-type domain-containing protein n=1 Tax=Pyramimonas obovata TaxID=1411642 RepID=A0A7S0N6P0_9CHLO|mmetsp:Transcript_20831/g.45643  ORF Transcript_20831/g.45643 Transcript_20831/m.45643 type:complete len:611 (+) Transcript_20831:115-1947(+)|eukprot:CAMPEP_0118938670 /NCGR_PEP_ID=MMETSP1169-20130426/26713_1 /TAXON_ID=36882 /ORGANISM="Pyramimonas obovata, Strain CCMP722" /LENGTH=610 /DNA_ID=CAMNT_0006882687 /DNA_START=70 /DNA_END=1902 /DNA_ORIENTATION=-
MGELQVEERQRKRLKSILKSVSTVARKYSDHNPVVSANKPTVTTNNKKKKKKVVKAPVIATRETTIHWADQSYGGQLERVELYSNNLWLSESKPSIAHLPRTASEIEASGNGTGEPVDEKHFSEEDTEDEASGKMSSEGAAKASEEKATPMSAKAAKRLKQKEKAEALKKAQGLRETHKKEKANNAAASRASTSVDSESSVTSATQEPTSQQEAPSPPQKEEDKTLAGKPPLPPSKKAAKERLCKGCSKSVDGSLECPLCVKEAKKANNPDLRSYFCSQPCFKASWAEHKKNAHPSGKGADTGATETAEHGTKGSGDSSGGARQKKAAAAALTAVVMLLQQGKNEMSKGATELKAQKYLDKAAVHYEAAIRLFRQAAAAGLQASEGDSASQYVTGAKMAEADSWRKLAYIRALQPEALGLMPWAQRAYVAACRLYMEVGQSRELASVLVDLARLQLAQTLYNQAQLTMARASALLAALGEGDSALSHASLLKYLAELKTELHLANPVAWDQAVGGQEEDMSMIEQAAAELQTAHKIFVAHQEHIPSAHRVLTSVRYALARATLLAGNLEDAQGHLVAVMADETWKAAEPEKAKMAADMSAKLIARARTAP